MGLPPHHNPAYRGRPYHISALYVVDLVRFRELAAGDQLRAIYDNLSRDPNSLANLDQDLPNYAQRMIPIFSLPIQWLWCESWCSDSTKSEAKTIDLCNNPLHKVRECGLLMHLLVLMRNACVTLFVLQEPKLDMAKRVVSGDLFPESWQELDGELAELDGVVASAGEVGDGDGAGEAAAEHTDL